MFTWLKAMPALEVLKPSPRASGLLGRALAVGDQLDCFLCALERKEAMVMVRGQTKDYHGLFMHVHVCY